MWEIGDLVDVAKCARWELITPRWNEDPSLYLKSRQTKIVLLPLSNFSCLDALEVYILAPILHLLHDWWIDDFEEQIFPRVMPKARYLALTLAKLLQFD